MFIRCSKPRVSATDQTILFDDVEPRRDIIFSNVEVSRGIKKKPLVDLFGLVRRERIFEASFAYLREWVLKRDANSVRFDSCLQPVVIETLWIDNGRILEESVCFKLVKVLICPPFRDRRLLCELLPTQFSVGMIQEYTVKTFFYKFPLPSRTLKQHTIHVITLTHIRNRTFGHSGYIYT